MLWNVSLVRAVVLDVVPDKLGWRGAFFLVCAVLLDILREVSCVFRKLFSAVLNEALVCFFVRKRSLGL